MVKKNKVLQFRIFSHLHFMRVMSITPKLTAFSFLTGGGGAGDLIRAIDWEKTSLGESDTWPSPLKILLQTILDNPFPMYITWGPEHLQFYNDAFRPILGATKHPQAMGISATITFAEIWDTIGPLFQEVWKGNSVQDRDLMLVLDRNGYPEECYFDFSYSAIRNEESKVHGILVTVMEVTEKNVLVKQLKESGQHLIDFLSQAPVAMCILKGPHHIVEIASEKIIRLWGKTSEQVMNRPLFEGLPEAKEQGLEELLNHVYETGERYVAYERSVNLPRENGIETTYQNFVYEPFLESDGTISGVIAVTQEVTEQVLIRKKIEEAEERARLAIEAAQLGTFDFDIANAINISSSRLYEIFNIPENSTHSDFVKRIHPEDLIIREKAISEALKTGSLFYEARLIHADGSLHWIRIEGKVLFDKDGKPYRMLGTALDITNFKEQDLKREEYIAIASHELKNPLTTLRLSMQLILKTEEEQARTVLYNKAGMQINRIISLTDELLNVSKISSGILDLNKEKFNLQDCIAECIETFLAGSQKNKIALTGNPSIIINGDRFRIEQVLINLLSNASKYSPPGSPIQINVLPENEELTISVRDHGIGIDADKIPDLFKKFIRIHPDRHIAGYGLGLYISKQIIEKHGGRIGVESEKGKGSLFWFTIPM